MRHRKWIFYLCFIFAISATTKTSAKELIVPIKVNDPFFQQTVRSNEIRVMSYNVLNLFDTKHDPDFFDYTFLPKSHPDKQEECDSLKDGYYKNLCHNLDWTPSRLRKKLRQLRKVILGHGSMPDILALQEVENENVIQMLANFLGYEYYIVTEYQNRRGIDVAVLFNTRHIQYVNETTIPAPGRDPLRVEFKLTATGERLFLYVNHWQAQMAPTRKRVEAAKAIRADVDLLHEKFSGTINVLSLGDFNTTFREKRKVFDEVLHDENWSNKLYDIHDLAFTKYPHFKDSMPNGSYLFSRNKWERFDRFFVNKSLLQGRVRILRGSYRVIYSEFLTGEYIYSKDDDDPNEPNILIRYPLRYNFLENPDYPLGYSDHLPISVILKVK